MSKKNIGLWRKAVLSALWAMAVDRQRDDFYNEWYRQLTM